MAISSFDVMKAMAEANQDILRMQKTKAGTQITIGVPGGVLTAIYAGRFVGGLILADKQQFEEMKRKLESEEAADGRPNR